MGKNGRILAIGLSGSSAVVGASAISNNKQSSSYCEENKSNSNSNKSVLGQLEELSQRLKNVESVLMGAPSTSSTTTTTSSVVTNTKKNVDDKKKYLSAMSSKKK